MNLLNQLEYGVTLEAFGEELKTVIEGVRDTGKQGAITLTLKVSLETPGQISIEPDIKSKVPRAKRGKNLFFLTPDGNLTRNDPRQAEIEGLRVVPAISTPLKQAI